MGGVDELSKNIQIVEKSVGNPSEFHAVRFEMQTKEHILESIIHIKERTSNGMRNDPYRPRGQPRKRHGSIRRSHNFETNLDLPTTFQTFHTFSKITNFLHFRPSKCLPLP